MKKPGIECQIFTSIILLLTNLLYLSDSYEALTFLEFVSIIISLFAGFLLISFILSVSAYLFLSVNLFFLLLASAINYYKFHYKIVISTSLIESMFGTDSGEVFELFNLSVLLWFSVSALLPFILIFLLARLKKQTSLKKRYLLFVTSVVLVSISIFLLPKTHYKSKFLINSLSSFMPFNYVLSIKNFWLISSAKKSRIDINKQFEFNKTESDKDGLNVVLVIGESARFDRFNINGYEKNTTPNLSKMKNLISYSKAHSLATNTVQGVQRIMQMNDRNDLSSFIQIFNKLDFQTYWFSNQSTRYKLINEIAREASSYISSDDIRAKKTGNNYDVDLLSYVQEALPESKLNMMVLHTMGSHRLYDLRYPIEFQQFKPTCISGDLYYSASECVDQEKLNNSYDNTILYTDHFLSELIKILEKTNSILIYLSDHGESLGENGVYAHASPLESAPLEQVHIPLFVWASDGFLSKDSNKIMFDKINQNSSSSIDQSWIFHSILDCTGVTSDSIDLNKSVCRGVK